MFLSKLGYSELVQRIFEKITFFRVDPLNQRDSNTSPGRILLGLSTDTLFGGV